MFLEWIGMNAMLVFVMAAQGIFAAFINGWYYEDPKNSLVSTIFFSSMLKNVTSRTKSSLMAPDWLEMLIIHR